MSESQTPFLGEHQAPEQETAKAGNSTYSPSIEERQAIKLVNSLFDKAKRHRKKYDENWLEYYKFFRGKQWKEQRPTYRHSEVINFIFQAIQSVVPILTDTRPRFEFYPQEPQDTELAKILTDVSASDWERGNWLLKLCENLYDSHIVGAAFGEMCFDPKARLGLGQIDFDTGDPFYCFPDPKAHDINDKRGRFFIYAEPEDIETLRREYPEHRDHFKGDLIDLIQGDKTDLDQVRYKSPVDPKTVVEGGSAYEAGHRNQALKITCYLQSDEFVEIEKERRGDDGSALLGPDGQPIKYFEQRLKYPNGRRIIVAGGVLVEDGPNPYEDGLIPYARLVNYILPREFWGMSEVEQLKSPQKIFNKLVSYALDVLTLMGNPIWKVGTNSGVDTDNLFNRPGLIVECDDITQVQREEGVALQPYVLQLIDRMAQWFDSISGANDVTRGVRPEGITAASAITSLQEAAQTRIRQKSRNLDAYLQSLGQLYKNRVFQFYSAPRIFRLTNDQNVTQYFKFHIENRPGMDEATGEPDGTTQKIATVRPFTQTEQGGYLESPDAREFLIRGDFDVKVSTGSSLPFAKAEKANLAFKLKEAGALDELELLKAVEYPNAEGVWEAVKARQMEMMQAQAAAQPPSMPPGGAPPPAA
jgi:hypothetical protein